MKLQPFETQNLIFLDTEFSDLDPYKGELLSVGIVTLDGRELYVECAYDGPVNEWVAKHIVPQLQEEKLSREQVMDAISVFLDGTDPYAVAFVDNYDIIYLTKYFGAGKLPFKWMSVDFASILFAMGINPVKFQRGENGAKDFYKKLGIDTKKYRNHHALDDARIVRDAWLKMTDSSDASSGDASNITARPA